MTTLKSKLKLLLFILGTLILVITLIGLLLCFYGPFIFGDKTTVLIFPFYSQDISRDILDNLQTGIEKSVNQLPYKLCRKWPVCPWSVSRKSLPKWKPGIKKNRNRKKAWMRKLSAPSSLSAFVLLLDIFNFYVNISRQEKIKNLY